MFEIRDAELNDLPVIVDIYNAAIPSRLATADIKPIEVSQRTDWFYLHDRDSYPLWVAIYGNQVVGWLSFSKFSERDGYICTAELSIYIYPEFHGRGVGTLLLNEALSMAKSLNFHTLLALIFSHNELSIKLFNKFGFVTWGELNEVAYMDGNYYGVTILGKSIS